MGAEAAGLVPNVMAIVLRVEIVIFEVLLPPKDAS